MNGAALGLQVDIYWNAERALVGHHDQNSSNIAWNTFHKHHLVVRSWLLVRQRRATAYRLWAQVSSQMGQGAEIWKLQPLTRNRV
jgi:hypothetical protein